MGPTPEALKQEIDQTRADLAETVDALADKVTPSPKAKRMGLMAAAGGVVGLLVIKFRRRRRQR